MILVLCLSLFVALSGHASELSIVETAISVNTKVQMNSCSETPSTDPKNICSVISELGTGDPTKFDTKNPYGLCAPIWKSATPIWDLPQTREKVQTYATTDFKPVPRSKYLTLNDYGVLDSDARKKLVVSVIDLRESSARACCANDDDCLTAMRGVRVSVCASSADQNPDASDDCQATSGAYNLTASEQSNILLQAARHSNAAKTQGALSSVLLKEAQKTFRYGITSTTPPKSPVLIDLSFTPASGEIILSPYSKQGQPLSDLGTLHHEFGHACSFIRRQLAMRDGQPFNEEASDQLFRSTQTSCEISRPAYDHVYGSILTNAGANKNVELCLLDLAQKSVDKTSSAFIENSCVLMKIEESTAEAFADYTMSLKGRDVYPDRVCSRLPSTKHPASIDVFDCVLKADPVKRNELAKAYRCEANP